MIIAHARAWDKNRFSYFYTNKDPDRFHRPLGSDYPFIVFPVPLFRIIKISAMMLTAISSGVSACNSKPMGEWMRAIFSSGTPCAFNALTVSSHLRFDPMTPM